MAGKTKAELQAEVLMLDPSAEVDGMTNTELTELLESLQGTETETAYCIAEGKSVHCRKGVLVGGEEIKADWLANGMDDLQNLITRGAVVES